MLPNRPLVPAAVLVPLVAHPAGLTVLLTLRTAHLSDHAGQISFPGGRIDPGDRDERDAALREAKEEIGVPPADVRLIGRLDTYVTRTGFRVEPLVGLLTPPLALRPDPHEVAEIFEVSLDFLIDPANRRRDSRIFEGSERFFWAIPHDGRYIWGATAGMLVNLAEVLGAPAHAGTA
jgi:8-oxo-dGTP pyrophosphatase MutT (NUDIX family)